MNSTKKILAVASAAFTTQFAGAVPVVSGVDMNQPSKTVVITYTLSGEAGVVTLDVQTNANTSAAADDPGWTSIGGAAVCNAQGDVWKKVEIGSRRITWRPDHSWPGHVIANGGARAVVTAWSLGNTPNYMAVDVSAGAQPNTQTYYPAADFVPGGVSNSLYKTTMLLMRKIMAKDVKWTMGSTTLETQRFSWCEATHQVTLTNNYYIGVYEVTQAQWDLIQPDRLAPSYFDNVADRAMRPVEQVCYNEIRHAANSTTADVAYYWPADPNPNSFLGKLRTKTGIDFDLPSEAQWEFAARAGNGDTKWGDGSSILNEGPDANLNRLGRYDSTGGRVWDGTSFSDPAKTCGAANATAIVGSYASNAWGLYDMAGNVWEVCLDWREDNITANGGKVNIDPLAPQKTLSGAQGEYRVIRGGGWWFPASYCRPAARVVNCDQSDRSTGGSGAAGFRVVCLAGLQ